MNQDFGSVSVGFVNDDAQVHIYKSPLLRCRLKPYYEILLSNKIKEQEHCPVLLNIENPQVYK